MNARWLCFAALAHGLNMTSPRAARERAYTSGLAYLACRQSGGSRPALVRLGAGGGFGSMFQLTARAFVDALRGKQRGGYEPGAAEHGPVAFVGEWKFYTANRACNSTGYECHFLPLLQRRRGDASADACDEAFDPGVALRGPTFNSYWWWGVAQSYMLRPNPSLEAALAAATARAGLARDPDIALHMRFGDKQHDPDSHQPHAADARVTAEQYLELALGWATARRDACAGLQRRGGGGARRAEVWVATDSASAAAAARAWGRAHADLVAVRMQSEGTSSLSTLTRTLSGPKVEIALEGAKRRPAEQAALATEVLVDLVLLSRATALAGLCMSQLSEIAAAVGFARGTLRDAVALDPVNIARTNIWKYGAEEGWRAREAPSRAWRDHSDCGG